MSITRQWLVTIQANCLTCNAYCEARNAQAWAHNHARKNPHHAVGFGAHYAVRNNQYNEAIERGEMEAALASTAPAPKEEKST